MTQQDVIINKSYYKVYEKIGVGETTGSVILRARESTALDFVAYKKINIRNEQTKQSILKQIKYFKQLTHKNVVTLKDQSMDKSEQNIYLFFELLQQQTLDQIVQSDKAMPRFTVSIFAQDIRDLLLFVHGRQVLLNDLHSKNILPTVDGVLKFIDFEQAGSFKQVTLTKSKIESSIYKCGFTHRAPETLIEGGVYSTASDIYMLGQLVYFIAFGFYPFHEEAKHSQDYKEFAASLIAQDEKVVIKALQQQPLVDHQQISEELLAFLYETIQPIPFKRSTWSRLQKLPFLNMHEQFYKIQENVQGIYFQFLNQACQSNMFGPQYSNLRFDVHTGACNDQKLVQRIDQTNQQNGETMFSHILAKSSTIQHSNMNDQRKAEKIAQKQDNKLQHSSDSKIVRLQALKNIYQAVNSQYEQLQEYISVQEQVKVLPQFYAQFIQLYLKGRLQQLVEIPILVPLIQKEKIIQPQSQISIDELIAKYQLKQNNQVENDIIFQNLQQLSSQNKHSIEQITKIFDYCQQQINNLQNPNKIYYILTQIIDNNYNVVIQVISNQKIEIFQNILTTLEDQFLATQYHYAIYTSILQIFIIAFYQQMYKYSDFQLNYQIEFNKYLRKYIESSDEKFTEQYTNMTQDQMLCQLTQIQTFYSFCNNIASEMLYQEQRKIEANAKQPQKNQGQQNGDGIGEHFSLTPLIVTAQNIYMQLHQDQVQASIRQYGFISILKNITKLTTQSFKLMTDIRLEQLIDIKYIKVSNFDFTRIPNSPEKSAIADIMYALANISFLEHYQKMDFSLQNYTRRANQQGTKQSDIYILNNKNQLFQLIDYNSDLQVIDSIGTLLFSLILNDSFLESILKNPLNIKNHKLYRFSKLDNDIIGKIDQILQKAASSNQDTVIVQTVANLVNIIQVIMDIVSFSIKQYSISSAYINIKFYSKCYNCLEFLDIMLNSTIYMRFLKITQRQVQNIESIIFALSNTIYELKNDANNIYYQQLNMIEFKQFMEISTQVLAKYINVPWQQYVYKNLFTNVNNKFKGLWYALVSLLKCPNYQSFVEDKQEKSVQLAEAIYLIRQSIPQYFQASLEKYLENGPVGNNVYVQKSLYKQLSNNSTEVLANMPELGLVAGTIFTQDETQQFKLIAQNAILRLLTSKSMFFQLFSDQNIENIFNFLCYVLDIVYDKVPKEILDNFYKLGTSYISKQQIYQPKAYELLSILVKNSGEYFLNVCKEDVTTKALDNIKIGITLIEQECSKFVQVATQKMDNNVGNTDIQLIFNQDQNKGIVNKNMKRVTQYVNEITHIVGNYLSKSSMPADPVQSCIKVLINIGQLYLYNKCMPPDSIENVKQIVTKFVNNLQQNYEQSLEITLQMMELIVCYQQYFKDTWKEYPKIKSNIQQFVSASKGKLKQEFLYKYQQVNEDKGLIIISKDLVTD